MNVFWVMLRKELQEQVRTKRFLIMSAVFLFVALVSPISAKMIPKLFSSIPIQKGAVIKIPEATYLNAIDQYVKNSAQLLSMFLIFVAAGAVADEKVKKTLEMVLSKPVSRTAFIISKYLSYFASIAVLFCLELGIFIIYTQSIFGSFVVSNLLIVAGLTLIFVFLIVTVTIFASTFMKSAAAAGGLGFVGYLIVSAVLAVIPATAEFSPGYVLSHYQELMIKGWSMKFLPPAAVSLIAIVGLMVLSVRIFKGQEIER